MPPYTHYNVESWIDWPGCGGIKTSMCFCWKLKMTQPFWEKYIGISENVKHMPRSVPAILLLDIYTKDMKICLYQNLW